MDENGLTLHLTGTATPDRLHTLTTALPQFADGFPEPPAQPEAAAPAPLHLDYTVIRSWAGTQTWQPITAKPTPAPHPHRRKRP